eukprot:3399269-Pleurochrysis_carterae.AAC.1
MQLLPLSRVGHDASGEGGEVELQRVLSTFFGLQAFRPGQVARSTDTLMGAAIAFSGLFFKALRC